MVRTLWLPSSLILLSLASQSRAESGSNKSTSPSSTTLSLPVVHRIQGQAAWYPRGQLEINSATQTAQLISADEAWDPLDWAPAGGSSGKYQIGVGGGDDGLGSWNGQGWEGLSINILAGCNLAHPAQSPLEDRLTVYIANDSDTSRFAGFRYSTNSKGCNQSSSSLASSVVGGRTNTLVEVAFPVAPDPSVPSQRTVHA